MTEDNQKKAAEWIKKEVFFDIDGEILREALFDWAHNECACYECLVEYIKAVRGDDE